ncbi:MAG: hypothetical protein C0467_31230 [Planctomycetaceae bacterium]|nr:hypothetical protein [Planctomycetaceae bacterium]
MAWLGARPANAAGTRPLCLSRTRDSLLPLLRDRRPGVTPPTKNKNRATNAGPRNPFFCARHGLVGSFLRFGRDHAESYLDNSHENQLMLRFARVLPIMIAAFTGLIANGQPPTTPAKLTPAQIEKLKVRDRYESEANKSQSEGKLAAARAAVEKCLAIEREVFGDTHSELTPSLAMLTDLCRQAEDFRAAQDYAQQLLTLHTQLYGMSDWRTTDARRELDDVKLRTKLTPMQRANLTEATRLTQESIRSRDRGEYPKAVETAEKALALRRAILGEKHPDYADSLNNLAVMYNAQGLAAKVEALFVEALAVRKMALGEKHPDYADSLHNLANLYDTRGALTKAEPLFVEALTIRKVALGEKHPDYLRSLNNLAGLYHSQEAWAKAEPLYREVLVLTKRSLGEKHPDYLRSLNNFAGLYYGQGLFAKAEPLLKEVLATRKAVLGEKHPTYANSLSNLALLYDSQGVFANAEPLYLQALAVLQEARREKHPDYIATLNNLAVMYQSQSLFAKAEPLTKEVLSLSKVSLGEKHPDYADSLNNLAYLYQSQGEHAKAEPLYLETLAIRKATLGEKHPRYAISLNNLASASSGQGFHTKSVPLCVEAIGILENHLEQSAAIQSESGQFSHTAATRVYLDNLLSIPHTDAAQVYAVVFRWRGAVTARQTFARAARGTDPVSLRILNELRDVSRRLSNLVNNPPKPGSGVNIPKLMADLDAERESLGKSLASRSKDFAKYRESRDLKVADIQKLLPVDAALVDFLVHGNRIAAFVITQKSIVRVDLKPSSSDIAEMVKDFCSELSLMRMRPVQGNGDMSILREAVWGPLVPHLGGATLVLICPDGPLCRLPFAALRGTDPKKFLIEELAIAVVPVPRLLPELLADRPARQASLLVVGDVDFSGDPGAGKLSSEVPVASPTRAGGLMAWKPLDATAGEIRKIEDLFRKNVAGAVVTTLSKEDATEVAIRRVAGKNRYLHFATHGFFDETGPSVKPDPRSSGLIGDRVRPTGPNPGLLCGLVCAGANKPTPDDDGVLTALEIADLDLGAVDLAVLSACETGLGKLVAGDGVLGLQRAFQMAGTRTTVTSLWQVPDQSTGTLMARFYENRLSKTMPPLKALREAQLWVLNEGVKAGVLEEEPKNGRRTPPLYWAAFVLAGDWR